MATKEKKMNIPLLEGLHKNEIAEVMQAGKVLKLKAGEYIIHKGDKGNEMFVVLSGKVRAEAEVGGETQVIAEFIEGQIFGEIAFVSSALRTADVIACEGIKVLVLSHEFLKALIQKMPATAATVLFNLSLILCQRLINTTRLWMDSEYESILSIFQTLSSETELQSVFNKFAEAVDKALPHVEAVDFFSEGINFHWSLLNVPSINLAPKELEKITGIHIDKQQSLTICPIQVEGRARSYIIIKQVDGEKSFSPKELEILTGVSKQLYLVMDRILLYEETKALATTDPLTGLANRHVFNKELDREVLRAKRYGHALSLIVADLDHFKKINDTYGHLAGDETLKAVGAIFSTMVRKIDLVCRYGGEEFTILLPVTDIHGAKIIAERLRESIEKQVINFNDTNIRLTISLGAAMYQGETQEEFFQRADSAAYAAKLAGRNQLKVAKAK